MEKEKLVMLDKIINILKSKPKIAMIGSTKELGPCEIGIAYPDYPTWVYEVELLFKPTVNYLKIIENITPRKKSIAKYTMDEIVAGLTHFIRGERFCDGHMATMIRGGQLLQLLERYKDLIQKEEQHD